MGMAKVLIPASANGLDLERNLYPPQDVVKKMATTKKRKILIFNTHRLYVELRRKKPRYANGKDSRVERGFT